MSETETEVVTRIYVASLSDYNAGRLHGVWINLTECDDEQDLWAKVNAMLAASPEYRAFPQGGPAEEWAIHDYEGFGEWKVSEYSDLTKCLRVAKLIGEHGLALAAWVSNDESVLEDDDDSLEESFTESYRGEWDKLEDYAREEVGELGLPGIGYVFPEVRWDQKRPPWSEVLDDLDGLLDWERITRDVTEDYTTIDTPDHKVWVFSNH